MHNFGSSKTITGLDYIFEQHDRCLIRNRNCLLFARIWVHIRFLVGTMLLIFLVFCVVFRVFFLIYF